MADEGAGWILYVGESDSYSDGLGQYLHEQVMLKRADQQKK
jgi:hypothetical protein